MMALNSEEGNMLMYFRRQIRNAKFNSVRPTMLWSPYKIVIVDFLLSKINYSKLIRPTLFLCSINAMKLWTISFCTGHSKYLPLITELPFLIFILKFCNTRKFSNGLPMVWKEVNHFLVIILETFINLFN